MHGETGELLETFFYRRFVAAITAALSAHVAQACSASQHQVVILGLVGYQMLVMGFSPKFFCGTGQGHWLHCKKGGEHWYESEVTVTDNIAQMITRNIILC